MSISHWFLRFVLWFVAVFFCVLPVGLIVAKDPTSVSKLLSSANYLAFARDMMLCTIAVLALGLIDAFDCVAEKIHSKQIQTEVITWSCVLILAIVVQLVVYSFWSASMEEDANATTWPYLMGAVVSSLIARLAMLA